MERVKKNVAYSSKENYGRFTRVLYPPDQNDVQTYAHRFRTRSVFRHKYRRQDFHREHGRGQYHDVVFGHAGVDQFQIHQTNPGGRESDLAGTSKRLRACSLTRRPAVGAK